MKSKAIVFVLLLLLASAASGQDWQSMVGLFFDEEYLNSCLETTTYMTACYLFVLSAEDGFRCVSLQIQSSPELTILNTYYNPLIGIPITGGIPGDATLCFSTCQTDNAMWIATFYAFLPSPSEQFLGILPFTGDDYPIVTHCDLVERPSYVWSGLGFNTNCSMNAFPPGSNLTEVVVEEMTSVVAVFGQQLLPYSAEDVTNYSIVEKETQAPVEIVSAELGGNYRLVTLTLGSQVTPNLIYTLSAEVMNAVGGACINIIYDCIPSTRDFSLTPIATLLEDFNAVLNNGNVELTWRMSSIDDAVTFTVSRSASDGRWTELPQDAVAQEGLSFTCVDEEVEPGESYIYRVECDSYGSRILLFQTERITTPAMPLSLEQNAPNPFNPSTEIRYYLPEACGARLGVYDISGRLVKRLVDGWQTGGWHVAGWDGRDTGGAESASGVYFCRLTAGKTTLSRKMVLLR